MKIVEVSMVPLRSKYYETEVQVRCEYNGETCLVRINLFGGSYVNPSDREIERGWEPDYGMDHVESQEVYLVAKKIVEALNQ